MIAVVITLQYLALRIMLLLSTSTSISTSTTILLWNKKQNISSLSSSTIGISQHFVNISNVTNCLNSYYTYRDGEGRIDNTIGNNPYSLLYGICKKVTTVDMNSSFLQRSRYAPNNYQIHSSTTTTTNTTNTTSTKILTKTTQIQICNKQIQEPTLPIQEYDQGFPESTMQHFHLATAHISPTNNTTYRKEDNNWIDIKDVSFDTNKSRHENCSNTTNPDKMTGIDGSVGALLLLHGLVGSMVPPVGVATLEKTVTTALEHSLFVAVFASKSQQQQQARNLATSAARAIASSTTTTTTKTTAKITRRTVTTAKAFEKSSKSYLTRSSPVLFTVVSTASEKAATVVGTSGSIRIVVGKHSMERLVELVGKQAVKRKTKATSTTMHTSTAAVRAFMERIIATPSHAKPWRGSSGAITATAVQTFHNNNFLLRSGVERRNIASTVTNVGHARSIFVPRPAVARLESKIKSASSSPSVRYFHKIQHVNAVRPAMPTALRVAQQRQKPLLLQQQQRWWSKWGRIRVPTHIMVRLGQSCLVAIPAVAGLFSLSLFRDDVRRVREEWKLMLLLLRSSHKNDSRNNHNQNTIFPNQTNVETITTKTTTKQRFELTTTTTTTRFMIVSSIILLGTIGLADLMDVFLHFIMAWIVYSNNNNNTMEAFGNNNNNNPDSNKHKVLLDIIDNLSSKCLVVSTLCILLGEVFSFYCRRIYQQQEQQQLQQNTNFPTMTSSNTLQETQSQHILIE